MKVLLITSTLKIDSGWGRSASAIYRALSKHIKVEVVTEDGTGTINERLAPVSLSGFIKNCMLVRRLARSYDCIHALDGWPYAIYGYIAVLGTSKKFLVNAIGTYSVAPLYQGFVKRVLLARAYRKAQKIFCLSAYTKNLIEKKLPLETLEINNFGTNPLGAPAPEVLAALSEQYGLKQSDHPIVITIGAIKERKGQLDTLKAIELLKGRYPQIRYFMIGAMGDPFYTKQIEEYIIANGLKDTAFVVGAVTDQVLAGFCVLSTLLALNSNNDGLHFEGYGMVVLEVAAFGKPSIGSEHTGIEELIKHDVNGYLTRQKDHKDIAEKIEKVLENYERLSKGAVLFQQDFTWEKTVTKYLEVYRA